MRWERGAWDAAWGSSLLMLGGKEARGFSFRVKRISGYLGSGQKGGVVFRREVQVTDEGRKRGLGWDKRGAQVGACMYT